jgi:DNA-binding CsgD family transcriptional regulator
MWRDLEPLLQFLSDGDQRATIVCDSEFRIVVANREAHRLACEPAPFTSRGGILRLCGFSSAEVVQRAIARGDCTSSRICGEFGVYSLEAVRVPARNGLAAFIALRMSRDVEIGALTPAECDVATGLFEGLSLVGIAARRGVSINTVKTQARALQSKLHAHTRAALIRRLCEGRSPSSSLHRSNSPADLAASGRKHRPSAPSSPGRRRPKPSTE